MRFLRARLAALWLALPGVEAGPLDAPSVPRVPEPAASTRSPISPPVFVQVALFPGRDYLDQLRLVIELLGPPTAEQRREPPVLTGATARLPPRLRGLGPVQSATLGMRVETRAESREPKPRGHQLGSASRRFATVYIQQEEEEELIESEATVSFVRKVSPEMPEHQTTAPTTALALPKP